MTRVEKSRTRFAQRRSFRRVGVGSGIAAFAAAAVVTTAAMSSAGPTVSRVQAPALQRVGRLASPLLLAKSPQPALPRGAVTVSPEPGSQTADPHTQVSFLGRPASQLGAITVTGSVSGVHAGTLEAYSTGNGASFLPTTPFTPGETVTVATSLPIAGGTNGDFTFTVAQTVPLLGPVVHPVVHTNAAAVLHFVSTPKLAPPAVTVTSDSLATGGDFFLAPKGSAGQAGPLIVAPNGQPVWFRPLHGNTEAFDLNVQSYEGQPVLTWFQGEVISGHGQGVGMIANEHYQTVAVVHGGNGLQVDLHDFQLTPQGTAFITAYRTMRWNTTSDGGITNGTIFDGVVQEIDVKTGLVMMEWDSLDHIPVAASDFTAPKSPANPFDYFHINAIQPLARGDFLVSSRNASAAYEVDPADAGRILWTLGGKDPSMQMGTGTQFWYEHDVELRPGNRITVFDDGASPARESASRALTLQVDPKTGAVRMLSAYSQPGVLAAALGNVQLITGGDEVVGWGTAPNYSVYSSSGALLYNATLPSGVDSYRAYLHTWVGRPTNPPAVAVLSGGRLAMSWNGETGIERWRVLTGADGKHLAIAATVASAGYQTLVTIAHLGALVQVQALDARGHVLGTSSPARG